MGTDTFVFRVANAANPALYSSATVTVTMLGISPQRDAGFSAARVNAHHAHRHRRRGGHAAIPLRHRVPQPGWQLGAVQPVYRQRLPGRLYLHLDPANGAPVYAGGVCARSGRAYPDDLYQLQHVARRADRGDIEHRPALPATGRRGDHPYRGGAGRHCSRRCRVSIHRAIPQCRRQLGADAAAARLCEQPAIRLDTGKRGELHAGG